MKRKEEEAKGEKCAKSVAGGATWSPMSLQLLLAILTSERSTSPIFIQISFCFHFSLSFISSVKDQTCFLL
jgi:hypothetical protein